MPGNTRIHILVIIKQIILTINRIKTTILITFPTKFQSLNHRSKAVSNLKWGRRMISEKMHGITLVFCFDIFMKTTHV